MAPKPLLSRSLVLLFLALSCPRFSWALNAELLKQLRSDDPKARERARTLALRDRARLVAELRAIVADKKMQVERLPTVVNAIRLLGDLRAMEAVPKLLEMILFDRVHGLPPFQFIIRSPAPATLDPAKMSHEYPCVGALIEIRPPIRMLLQKLSRRPFHEHYLAVLIGMEGKFLARAILKAELQRVTAALTPAEKEIEKHIKGEKPVGVIPPRVQAKRGLERSLRLVEDYIKEQENNRPRR